MSQHVYILIEALSMTAGQRNTLVAALRGLGPASDPQPANINHAKVRLDNLAMIIEAAFGDNDLTIASVTNFLATAFAVDPATISTVAIISSYGAQVTFSRGGTARLRFTLLGGASPTWQQSRASALQYLADNAVDWEG